MQVIQQQKLLIDEQKINEPNPLFALDNVTKHVTKPDTNSESVQPQTCTTVTSTNKVSPTLKKYIKYIQDIISIHHSNKV
jgi:hypothetical protein